MRNTLRLKGTEWATGSWKISSLIFIFFLSIPVVFGQRTLSTDVWHQGLVILEKGDTLLGSIKYNLETGVVQFVDKNKGDTEAFTPKNIYYFQLFDEIYNRQRRFFSLPYEMNPGFQSLMFFEVLVEGNMNLLARERRTTITKSDYYWGIYYSYGEEVLQYEYYILLKSGKIERYNGKLKSFLGFCGSKAPMVKKYIRENGYKTKNKAHLAKIVNYYNTLK